jgi:hypothetical protein
MLAYGIDDDSVGDDHNSLLTRLSACVKDNLEDRRIIREQLIPLGVDKLEELGLDVIEFLSFICAFSGDVNPLRKRILKRRGEVYAQQLERARLTAWQGFSSRDYGSIKGI